MSQNVRYDLYYMDQSRYTLEAMANPTEAEIKGQIDDHKLFYRYVIRYNVNEIGVRSGPKEIFYCSPQYQDEAKAISLAATVGDVKSGPPANKIKLVTEVPTPQEFTPELMKEIRALADEWRENYERQRPRWKRTEVDELKVRVRDLESQLEQARKTNDQASMIDMLQRAGRAFIANVDPHNNYVCTCGVYFYFDKDGKLL